MEAAAFEKVVKRRKDLRFPLPDDFEAVLTGARVVALRRRAKYILVELDNATTLAMHLGMSGRFTIIGPAGQAEEPGRFHHETGDTGPHDHIEFLMSNGHRIVYSDPRRFGYMLLIASASLEWHPLFSRIGVEPLGNAFHAAHLASSLAGRHTPLKAALLDQKVVAGLGNIYVCEALHRAGLSPRRLARTIVRKDGSPGPRVERLAASIKAVLQDAIEAGGSTLRDYAQADGSLGYFQHRFSVYDREGEPCPKPDCTGTVVRIVQSNLSTFYCPVCQR